MKSRKILSGLIAATFALSLVACGNSSRKTSTEDTNAKTLVINKDTKEIKMLCEVNGKYFTESTRHGIVFKDGSNGEKSVLRGLADEKKFYDALIELGAKAGNNLTAEDMKAKKDNGKSVEGDKLEAVVTWEGQEKEIPFEDIIKASEERPMDLRFGGNIESAKKNNTGCVLCLDSCATGITSDASYPTGTTQNNVVKFYGDEEVLPEDGTVVTVTFRTIK
ncbi:YdjY domain-containing protein [Clostridium ihumii]|uniref:YdjY domain-containing protein n=1 Tax=Clostridium ihumii TaxID=1470356 RepID=UPI003D33836B